MSEFEELFIDLKSHVAPGCEGRSVLAKKRNGRTFSPKPKKTPHQNASMPVRPVSIRKFSWETE